MAWQPPLLEAPWCLAWCLPGASLAVLMVLSCLPGAYWSFPPPWCLPGASQAVQLILSCLPGASLVPIGPFLPPWCLPGASQAVQLILSCLPGASLVPQAVQLVLSCLPGASQAVQGVLSCLPGASQAVQMVLSCGLDLKPWPWQITGVIRSCQATGKQEKHKQERSTKEPGRS